MLSWFSFWFLLLFMLTPGVQAATCIDIVNTLNHQLKPPLVDVTTVANTLSALNQGQLPPFYRTKRQARAAGWQPGASLWRIATLQGTAIGGDRFGNREHQLPQGQWQEADLDYRGGKRNAKRLVFARDGRRFITVDHYRTFAEVPLCH